MRGIDATVQGLIILTLIAALCVVMSQVLTVPENCRGFSDAGASNPECFKQFPPYPPKRINWASSEDRVPSR